MSIERIVEEIKEKTEKKEYNHRGIKEKEMYREMRISYVFDIFSDLGDL